MIILEKIINSIFENNIYRIDEIDILEILN